MWAQGYDGGHGPSHGQEPPWGAGEDAGEAEDEKEVEKLEGEIPSYLLEVSVTAFYDVD